jgi:hypothetical protein
MGYSPEFTKNMTAVYERLRSHPDTEVTLVRGADDLCKCYPEDKPNHCDAERVHARDAEVLSRLGLAHGASLTWRAVLERVKERMQPGDIPVMCATCHWQPYGVCEAGLSRIVDGQGLSPLPAEGA